MKGFRDPGLDSLKDPELQEWTDERIQRSGQGKFKGFRDPGMDSLKDPEILA